MTAVEVRGQEVAPGVVSTANSLRFEREIGFNDWRRLGEQISVTLERASWAIGDWRVYGDRWDTTGEDGKPDALAAIDRADVTLRQYAQVARTFPPDERSSLSWMHHFVLVGVKDHRSRLRWLSEAERHGWSTRELADRVNEGKIDGVRTPALSLRATGDVVGRFEARAAALGVPAKDLALEVLELASQLPDPLGALEAAGAHRQIGGGV